MKLINQFKNWLLNIIGHKCSPMITALTCIIIILLLISHGKSKEIKKLNEDNKILTDNFWINQVGHMDEALQHECGKKIKTIDSLYLEISDLGMQLDSMKLKYD